MITMDDDALHAAADLVGRCGAKEFELGWLHDDVPVEEMAWYAHAQFRGARIIEENHRGPIEAAEALARRLLTGGKCTHCGGLTTLTSGGAMAHPGPMADGSTWTIEEIKAAGQCRYRRVGARWVRGCETDDQTRWWEPRRDGEATADYLARVLEELGAPALAARARAFHYDDYLCPPDVDDGANIQRLVLAVCAWADTHGQPHRARVVAEAAKHGEFDGTSEESGAWARSEDGQAAFRELVASPPPPRPTRQQRRAMARAEAKRR